MMRRSVTPSSGDGVGVQASRWRPRLTSLASARWLRGHGPEGPGPSWATPSPGRKSLREPLPGYREAKPMVYTGLFPIDNKQYENLRDALEKLKVNDPSLVWEPETTWRSALASALASSAFCTWRSSRSASSASSTSTSLPRRPSVDYHVYKTDGEMIDVRIPRICPRLRASSTSRSPTSRPRSSAARLRAPSCSSLSITAALRPT